MTILSTTTPSALGLGDLGVVWLRDTASLDITIVDGDLGVDRGLVTAFALSIFLDRRAEADDVPPSADPTDRRGWWADEFLPVTGDRIGSRLWLLDRAKPKADTARLAEGYIREATRWAIEDHVASKIDVVVTVDTSTMLIDITAHRPDSTPLSLRFARAWEALP